MNNQNGGSIYQIDDKNFKTIFFGEDFLTLSSEQVNEEDPFLQSYKYNKLWDCFTKISYGDIVEVKLKGETFILKYYNNEIGENAKRTVSLGSKEISENLSTELSKISSLKKNIKKENSLLGMFNSRGFFAVIFSALLIYNSQNNINIAESGSGGRRRGRWLASLIDFLGPTLTLIIAILICALGLYFMIKKFKNPSEIILFQKIKK